MIGPDFAAGVFARDACRIAGAAFAAGVALACATFAIVWAIT